MKQLLLLLAVMAMVVFTSCNNTNEVLIKKIDSLEQELLRYKTDPQKLISDIDTLYKNNDSAGISQIKDTLLKYHPESEEAKMVSDLYTKLVQENYERRENERKECLSALDNLRKEKDDVYGVTYYRNKYFTHYANSNHVSVAIIYDEETKDVRLRLMISYRGEDWIFFEKVFLSYDGETQEIYFDEYEDKKTDHEAYIWEWINVDGEKYYSFLSDMVEGKKVKVRFAGKYSETRYLTSSEIKGIRDVLNGYKALKEYM